MAEIDALVEAAGRAGAAGGHPVEFMWQGRRWELRELPDPIQKTDRNWLFLILPLLLSLVACGVPVQGPAGSMILTLVIGSGLAAVLLAVPGAFSLRRLALILVPYSLFALSVFRLLSHWSQQGSELLTVVAIAAGILLVPILSGLGRKFSMPAYGNIFRGLTAVMTIGLAGVLAFGLLMLVTYMVITLFSEAGIRLDIWGDSPFARYVLSLSLLGITSALSRFMLTHDGDGLRIREGAFERLLRAVGTAYVAVVTPVLWVYLVFLTATGFAPILSTGRTTAIFGQLSLFGLIALSLMVGAGNEVSPKHPIGWRKIAAAILVVELLIMNCVAFYALNIRMASAALTVTRLAGRLYQLLLFGWMIALVVVTAIRHSDLFGSVRRVNRWGLLIALIVLVALCTNVLNLPAVAAASQLDALERGKIQANEFDFHYLEKLGRPALAPIDRAIDRVPSGTAALLKQTKERIQAQSPWTYISFYPVD